MSDYPVGIMEQSSLPGHGEALELLKDAVNALEEGFILWDQDLKFVFCNDKYREMVLPPYHPGPRPGQDAIEFGHEIFKTGFLNIPPGLDIYSFADGIGDFIRAYGKGMEITRKDGRVILASSNKTALGGYVLTFIDITDTKRAEAAEQNRWDVLNDAIGSLEEGFSLWDANFSLLLCNEKYIELVAPYRDTPWEQGTSGPEAIAEAFRAGIYDLPEGVTEQSYIDQWMVWARSHAGPAEARFKDGRIIVATAKPTPLGGVLITAVDVTEARKAEMAEKAASELVQKVVEACPANFLMSRVENGEVLFRSAASQELFGEKPSARGHWNNLADRERYLSTLMRDGRVDDMFVEGLKSDGTVFPSQVSARLVDYHGEQVIVSSTTDLTEAFALRDERDRANAQLREAVEAIDESLILFDENDELVVANAQHKKLFEPYRNDFDHPTSLGEVRRKAVEEGYLKVSKVPGGDLDTALERLKADQSINYEMSPADGSRWTARTVRLNGGGTVTTALDITEQLQAERLFADAIDNLPICIAVEGKDSKLTHCNDAFRDFYGLHWEELKQLTFDERMAIIYDKIALLDGKPFSGHPLEKHRSTQQATEAKFKDGRHYIFERAPSDNGQTVIVITEITKLKMAEEKRLESITDAIQGTDDAMVLFDKDVKFVLANRAWFEVFWPYRSPPTPGSDGREMFRHLIDEGFYVVPDGQSTESFLEFGMNAFFSFAKNIPLTVSDGRILMGSSHQTRLEGYLLSFKDITELRRTEEELVRQKEISHQNEKLSALGELLAGVAHELNNPLSVVFGYAQMLEGKVDDPKVAERLDLIRQSAERAAKIVKTFLAMARQRPTKIELCSINDAVTTAIEVSSYSLTANGTQVIIDLDDTVPPVTGDFDQLAQVFTNLIVNAGHALEPKRDLGVLMLRSYYDTKTDHTVVEVRDNGPGIPKEIQSRIFEPFFTTKDVGEGTGVGLAFSHRIVESHGGVLELRSQFDSGTSFFIKLRAAKDIDECEKDPDDAERPASASILVVDDEAGVAQLTHDLLTDEGFTVTQSVNPREALAILESQTFDVVLSDFKMPGMDGEQFYKALSVIAPECADRIGFITGDAMSANVRTFFEKSGRPHIEKPIMRDELLGLVMALCECTEGTE